MSYPTVKLKISNQNNVVRITLACPPRDSLDTTTLDSEVDTSLRATVFFEVNTLRLTIDHMTSFRRRHRVGSLTPQLAPVVRSLTIDVSITFNCPCPFMAE